VLVEVSVPAGLDTEACDPGALRIWSNAAEDGNYLAFGGPGTTPVYIVETPSGRVVVDTGSAPEATAADLAELQAIVDSIQFESTP
jgi:glyoxylase-like metal-dependent hydrolase (beta-lactamase superfamily II)